MAGTPVQVIRAEVTLNPSASSRERIMNVWHFATVGAGTPSALAGTVTSTLDDFYQDIDTYLSSELTGAVPLIRFFNLIEPKPRQPYVENTLTTLACAVTRANREDAVCLSYKALYQSGVTPKRRRGRIYLGPLSNGALGATSGKLDPTVKTAFVSAAQTLFDIHDAATAWSWVVYSPTTDTAGTGETGAYEVVSGWIDDEIDTQRRRGLPQPGVKTTFGP